VVKPEIGIFRTFPVPYHSNAGIHFLQKESNSEYKCCNGIFKKSFEKDFGRKWVHAFTVSPLHYSIDKRCKTMTQ